MSNLPKCPFGASDCFAFDWQTKKCSALENTKFHPKRGCRFYKTKIQNDAEVEAAKKKNERRENNE